MSEDDVGLAVGDLIAARRKEAGAEAAYRVNQNTIERLRDAAEPLHAEHMEAITRRRTCEQAVLDAARKAASE